MYPAAYHGVNTHCKGTEASMISVFGTKNNGSRELNSMWHTTSLHLRKCCWITETHPHWGGDHRVTTTNQQFSVVW